MCVTERLWEESERGMVGDGGVNESHIVTGFHVSSGLKAVPPPLSAGREDSSEAGKGRKGSGNGGGRSERRRGRLGEH